MTFLLVVYFILNYRSGIRREYLRSGPPPSEAGRTRVTESEYFASEHKSDHGSKWKWLGPLAAGGALWAFMRNRGKNKEGARSRSPSMSSMSRSRGPEVLPSRRGSDSYYTEKYSELPTQKKSGGGFMKGLAGAAGIFGATKLVSGMMNRGKDRHIDEYSAVSTETPRRARTGRGIPESELSSEYTEDISRRDPAGTSLLSPNPTAMAGAISAADSRLGGRGPVTPSKPSNARRFASRRDSFEDSEYHSYVSPSRRMPEDEPRSAGGGMGKGLLAGLGLGWFGKKMADRRARKEEQRRFQDEEDMRSGLTDSRYTGDGYPSPTRKPSRRPPVRRPTGIPSQVTQVTATEMTESSIDERPPGAPPVPVPGSHSRSRSRSRATIKPVAMPAMPLDPSDAESSFVSEATRATRRRDGEKASAEAAARAAGLAAEEGRERYGSPHSQPVSLKLRMHDDRDRNVTLRRLTEEEAREARGARSRSRADSEVTASEMESPSYGRGRYRRNSSAQRRAESAAEKRVEAGDDLGPLSPPNPAFAKGRKARAAKDSAYYSGPSTSGPPPPPAPPVQSGPSGMSAAAGQTVSTLASDSHATWSQMTPSPSQQGGDKTAENRRRRRLERRRGSSSTRPTGADMYD